MHVRMQPECRKCFGAPLLMLAAWTMTSVSALYGIHQGGAEAASS